MPRKKGWKYNERDAALIAAFLEQRYLKVNTTRDAFAIISPENRDEWWEGNMTYLSHQVAILKTLYAQAKATQHHAKPADYPEGG